MADQMDIHNVALGLGGIHTQTAAGSIALLPVPKWGGGITILNAHLRGGGTCTGTLNGVRLVTMTPCGTASGTPTISGTLGTIAAATWTNSIGVVTAIPLDTSYVSVGTVGAWIGLLYGGTILSGDVVLNLSYVMGK